MSKEETHKIKSSGADATFKAGVNFGQRCKGGEVFLLVSDLGGGKTTFAKGLAKGLGSQDAVSSPTFTLSRVYKGKNNLSMHHFDFYRLNSPGVVAYELAEIIDDPQAVVAIEWGDIVSDVLPDKRVTIQFEKTKESEDERLLVINCPAELQYLMEDKSS